MDLGLITLIVVIILNSLFAFTIFMSGRNRVNVIFSSMILFVILWAVANYLAEVLNNSFAASFFVSLTYVAGIVIATLFFEFVLVFPREKRIAFFWKIGIYSLSTFFILLSFSRLMVKDVLIGEYINSMVGGPAISLYIFYFVFLMLISSVILFRKYFEMEGNERYQIFYVLSGVGLSVVGASSTNLIVPLLTNDWNLSRYGSYFTMFLVSFSAYAILKHQLFNIKLIAVETLSLAICLIFFIRFLLYPGTERVLNGIMFLVVVSFSIFLVYSVMRDIKDRERIKQLSKDLVVANEQLRQMDKQKSDFVSIASHQLRTPLTAIKGYASLLLEKTFGELPSKSIDPIRKIFESSQKMVMIVENFLTVSRIEQGRMYYKFEVIDLQNIVSDMVDGVRPIAEGCGLHVRFKHEKEKNFFVRVDNIKIKQVIHNLLDESIKHTPEGFIDVSLSHTLHGDRILVSISDTGEGATKAQLGQMFERRDPDIKPGEMRKETGVELYITREIVKAHRGKIWAESEGPGQGLTFFVELSAAHKDEEV